MLVLSLSIAINDGEFEPPKKKRYASARNGRGARYSHIRPINEFQGEGFNRSRHKRSDYGLPLVVLDRRFDGSQPCQNPWWMIDLTCIYMASNSGRERGEETIKRFFLRRKELVDLMLNALTGRFSRSSGIRGLFIEWMWAVYRWFIGSWCYLFVLLVVHEGRNFGIAVREPSARMYVSRRLVSFEAWAHW